ncbi:MAG: hypothetical protein H6807_09170 [Planctomycetes bacterium]|nr:hypothetical protein [Planctomycetota bacterium]
MRARLLGTALILAVLLVAGRETAKATILIKKDLSQLSVESEKIVVARVGSQQGAYAKGTKIIFTYTQLSVESTLKGAAVESLELAEVGGTLGNVTCVVSGMPRFKEGERVLLFLKKDALGQWRTHGCIQGRFDVVENLATGERLVKLDPALGHVHAGFFATEADPRPRAVTIEEFASKIENLIVAASKKEEGK